MAFDITGLPVYTDQSSQELISAALMQATSIEFMTIQAGKTAGTSTVNVVDSTITPVNSTCGYGSASGNDTVFTQIDLVVENKEVKEVLCPDNLYNTYLSANLVGGSNEVVPFEEMIAANKMAAIANYTEKTIWQGDGGSLPGLQAQITVTLGAASATATHTPWTGSTAIGHFWTVVAALPAEQMAQDDLVMYLAFPQYQALVQGLSAAGNNILSNIAANVGGVKASYFMYPGTNITVYAAAGASDPRMAILGGKKHVFFGTGLVDGRDSFKFIYDASNDQVNFLSKFKLGTAAYVSQFASNIA